MSGNPSSPQGTRKSRINAARNWLDRAEQQFESRQDILAVSTLMLAQAEMRLMVEAVTETPRVYECLPNPVHETKKRPALSRNVMAYAAMAACLMVGLVIGQYLNGPAPVQPSGEILPGVQIADETPAEISQPVIQVPQEEPVVEEPSEILIADAAIPEEETSETVQEEVPVTLRPVYHPRPSRPEPVPTVIPAAADVPDNEVREPVATAEETPQDAVTEQSSVDDIPSGNEISPAEIALRTVQALSERLFMEDAFHADL